MVFIELKMVIKYTVEGYDNYLKKIKELEDQKVKFYVLFKGSLDENGVCWCRDCVKAEPLIEEVVSKLPNSIHLLTVYVGDRKHWKDTACPFRSDKKVHLNVLPTMIRWNGPQRLEGHDFHNKDVISLAFEDET